MNAIKRELGDFIRATLSNDAHIGAKDEQYLIRRKLIAPFIPEISQLRLLAAAKIKASHWRKIREFIIRDVRSGYIETLEGEVSQPAQTRPNELVSGRYRIEVYAFQLIQNLDRFVERAWWIDLPAALEAWGRAKHYGALLGAVEFENLGKAEARGSEARAAGARRGGIATRKISPEECWAEVRALREEHPEALVKEIYGIVAQRLGVSYKTIHRTVRLDPALAAAVRLTRKRRNFPS